MAKPQQPEIARSGRGATDPSAVKSEHSVPPTERVAGADGGAPVPEDNTPGHHPEHEQDKPSGDAFVAKLHEHAAGSGEMPPSTGPSTRADERGNGDDGDASGTIAGDALRAAAGVVRKVREALPGD